MSPAISIPAGSWVLVTGATGFVATHVIRQFLQRGYKVRGTVRDIAQASWLVDKLFRLYAESGDLELVTVPDLATDGAFDEAVKGVSAVAHVAYISTMDPDPNNSIPQAVNAMRTQSWLAVALPLPTNDFTVDRDTWNEEAVKLAWAPPPYDSSRAMMVYAAGKYASEKEAWKFMENKPNFTLNVVAPFGVSGAPNHKKHAESGTNWTATFFRGQKDYLDAFPSSYFADVEDIAILHVAAVLDPEVKNARLHSWGHLIHWNDFLAIFRSLRPQKEFIPDYPDPKYLTLNTDQSPSLELLKKWGGKDGWKSLKDSLTESVDNEYFQLQEPGSEMSAVRTCPFYAKP
ncbi:hypothetical protein F53441_14654 [Fusarium austroafricanum]|uniref:3-beta hydroxysteroid dehydrogenase/isomerase domain-containing protein n=1 Tax=Fusarium austroafricanum TaxID=2364996 RepID=A0A8H4J9M8_9HYPO|nr:hypothetical protein F53441_14654 [Fusarium austroafricanum]